MELTKEYFDEKLKSLVTKDDLLGVARTTDLASIKDDIAEIKSDLKALSTRDDEDTKAVLRDISSLKKQLDALQKRVKALEPSRVS